MGRKCNVLDCPSDSKRPEDNGVTFHKMPIHTDLRPKWIELCRIPEERQVNKVIYVCSRHFRRTDFCNFKGTKYMLKQGALPSVFPWTKNTIRKQVTEKLLTSESSGENKSGDNKIIIPKLEKTEHSSKTISMNKLDQNTENKSKKSTRKRPKRTHGKSKQNVNTVSVNSINFVPGTRIEVNDFNDTWYSATILEVDQDENEVFLEFDKHLNRVNEWIPMDSSRLRPYQARVKDSFVVGERVMATWTETTNKFPATVQKILEGDAYEVLFDDGFTKVLKHHKMSKILDKNNATSTPVHASPLFDPVVGSKAERRERKRKINVAELFGVGKKKPKLEDVASKVVEEEEEEEGDGKEEGRDDNPANGGSLKIVMENDGYKCPIEGCGKCFRKENLAQMHIKHYHPEYTKFIGSTPNVADLAYARTVGESIEDVVLKAKTSPSVEKDKAVKADQISKPKMKTLTSKSTTKLEELPSDIALPPTSLGKDSEIIKLLNSEPKSNEVLPSSEIQAVDELMTKKLNTPHKLSNLPHPAPQNKYPVIKLEDLLRNSPSQFKKEEGRPGGIKTLLPVIRSKDTHRTTEIENEMDVIHSKSYKIHRNKISPEDDIKRRCRLLRSDSEELSNESIETLKLLDKSKRYISNNNEPLTKRKSYKGDIDVSECCEIDSRSQDSFKARPSNEATLTMCMTNNTQESPKVIIEEGEIIRLVHMRSEEIINCTCGITEEDGLMIQCELCLCWQHGHCHNIEKESQVPEKYICVICKNPRNLRQSQKHIHDQDWLKAGVLTSANFHAKDEEESKKLFEKLRKSHEITACLTETKEFLHNLKVKLAIAKNINHPKLYLWARPWTRQSSQGSLRLDLKQSILINYESDSNTNNSDVDHSYIRSNYLQNKTTKNNIESILSFSPNKKIESEKELISILEGDNDGKQTEINENTTSNFASKITLRNLDMSNKKHNKRSAISNSSGDIAEDIENVPQKSKGTQLSINKDLHHKGTSSGIPQPEAAIQSRDCQKNLLEHIDYYQNLVEERLNTIEQALHSIEESNDKDNENFSVLAVHMMMQDLQRLQYLAKMARQPSDITI